MRPHPAVLPGGCFFPFPQKEAGSPVPARASTSARFSLCQAGLQPSPEAQLLLPFNFLPFHAAPQPAVRAGHALRAHLVSPAWDCVCGAGHGHPGTGWSCPPEQLAPLGREPLDVQLLNPPCFVATCKLLLIFSPGAGQGVATVPASRQVLEKKCHWYF